MEGFLSWPKIKENFCELIEEDCFSNTPEDWASVRRSTEKLHYFSILLEEILSWRMAEDPRIFLLFSSLLETFLQIAITWNRRICINRCVTLYLILFHSLDPLQGLLELASFPMVLVWLPFLFIVFLTLLTARSLVN